MLEVEMMYVVLTFPKKTGSITNLSLNYIAGKRWHVVVEVGDWALLFREPATD